MLIRSSQYPLQKGDYEYYNRCLSKPDLRFSKLGVYDNTEKSVLLNTYGISHYNIMPAVDRDSAIYKDSSDSFNYFGRNTIQWE